MLVIRIEHFFTILAAVLVAGCAGQNINAPDDRSLAPPETEGTRTAPSPHIPSPANRTTFWDFEQMTLTNCHKQASVNDLPHPLFQDIVPEAWRDRNPIPMSRLFYDVFDCERFSWGGLERGPFRLVREYHSHFTAPEACADGDYDEPYVSVTWLVSDAEVAQELTRRWGVPVEVADVWRSGPGGLAGRIYAIEWEGPNGHEANLSYYTEGPGPNRLSKTNRFYFLGEDHTISIDWTRDYTSASTNGEVPIVNGTMDAGTLYHHMLGESYAALGDVSFDVDVAATITKFGDLTCTS